jgi:hypothetical protein
MVKKLAKSNSLKIISDGRQGFNKELISLHSPFLSFFLSSSSSSSFFDFFSPDDFSVLS